MNVEVRTDPFGGERLYARNGAVEFAVPLGYGIRVEHFAFCGGDNVFYRQPDGMRDLTTPDGWRLRGGHRLWLAPEGAKTYYPDNEPIRWERQGESIVLTQKADPWLCVRKQMVLSFEGEKGVRVLHRIENTGSSVLRCALWGISSMAPGGTERIRLPKRSGGYDPLHHLSLWDYTSLGDPRAKYARDEIVLKHEALDEKYKIGVGHPEGAVRYTNKGVTFVLRYDIGQGQPYPDGGVSFETFLCRHMVEMETLSPLRGIAPGGSAEHTEHWELQKGETA